MKTILDVLNLTTQFLEQKGFSHPRRQAQDLIGRALSLKPMELYLYFDRPLSASELDKCRQWLSRRAKNEPAAYIDGKTEFLDCAIRISRDVLIPRPETEILADKICSQLSQEEVNGKELWDVCTGSGCLGIALKKKYPLLKVMLSDISSPALSVAAANAEDNGVELQVVEGDLLAPFAGRHADYIVCNPPYISEEEYRHLDADVRDYEPRSALVGGKSGLEFYERLAVELPHFLKKGGKVWLELGGTQGEALLKLFDGGPWKVKRLEKDWAGWDRFFFLEIE